MKRRTKRIYFGPDDNPTSLWWTVGISAAKEDVLVSGNIIDALHGKSGSTIGCAMSNMAKRNSKNFPHPVYLVSVIKSKLYAVDKLKKNGEPWHAIEYSHNYGKFVENNDAGVLQKDPLAMRRDFVLKVPRPPRVGQKPHATGVKSNSIGKKTFVHRGALMRAVKARLITANAVMQLSQESA